MNVQTILEIQRVCEIIINVAKYRKICLILKYSGEKNKYIFTSAFGKVG